MSVPQEQMMAAMSQEAPPVSNQPELVGGVPPDQLPPEVTVADDVPRDTKEGGFVLNAPAVEFAGLNDVADMLLNAMKKARQLGIDKPAEGDSISDEEIVNLLVSRGEILIPDHLARIIGYDTLNKMNARGEREVARRQELASQEQSQEQAPTPGMDMQMDQLVAQQAQPNEPPIQAMAEGGQVEQTGWLDAFLNPLDTYSDVTAIRDFAEEETQNLRKAYGTKALAVDNELDAFRHLLGAAILYKNYNENLASGMLIANEIKGSPGDYIASALNPQASSASKSRAMDYHNNDVAKFLVSQIPTNKLAQMDNKAMSYYVREYMKEVREAMQDGSIEAIPPSLVPMFSPEGNTGYTFLEEAEPAVDTKSLYIKGPDNNWMENPNHPDVKARQRQRESQPRP